MCTPEIRVGFTQCQYRRRRKIAFLLKFIFIKIFFFFNITAGNNTRYILRVKTTALLLIEIKKYHKEKLINFQKFTVL